ncbi:ubiquinone biosynthesis protein UbiH [Sphingomonas sp. MAH-20]|uniref:Ubiquinone biosynthesis protein UbiH n=1 Tax=Sphingomonas horti TaxID=2682842 RepID=A0A6I4IXE9_9SPHN|nr:MULTISPECIES: UbiH/UbiF/VisC/COQ6 family ubiquinone biosynthesis hydroxylase [Sphingomonas]MBA2920886.1 UbiH/UbiF/VisC/COQ6 family ubiquinone biosynthesis hydroxylase [Sphingomonas sp. CGMCC 1.13658]MVO76872.1 ubiquinone biosynthesis protein UbiH [Sphingomonas horti]
MQSDVIILGGGLVGLTLALALDAHGLSSTVVDPANPEAVLAPGFDGRASAIASASWRMLQAIGLGDRLEGKGCPIAQIRVSDGLKPGALDFEPAPDDGALGIMFENRLLRQALHAAAAEAKHVTLLMPARPVETERGDHGVTVRLADGRAITAPLLVAAEGRNSPTRSAAGINVARWQYEHSAIIAAVEHEKPHENVAYEIFYPTGPFAILPMLPGNRSALVWSVAKADAAGYLKLGPRGFVAELEKKMGGLLGKLELIAPLSSYPLGFHHAGRITDQRLALVGDAAHGIHPIAGQGLNLGLRDAAALTEVLVEGARLGLDLGDAQLLKRYERWRSLDTFLVAASTDGLARLFGIPGDTASAVRRFGLSAVQRITPLKSFFMAEARGEYGDRPKLLSGLTV